MRSRIRNAVNREEASMNRRHLLLLSCALALALPSAANAQKAIKVGVPMILSGPGALFGEPTLKGAQMYVDEVNAAGRRAGGRKIELVARDTKGNADEAVRVARDLILRENVDFLVGTFTSAEGPAVSPIAKENKIVFIAPVTKTDQLIAPANLHPYVFRTASTTTIEGRTAAELIAKLNVKRVATISPDYAYGQDVTKSFVEHLKKIKPDVEIVDQQWPKLGEADYTPFINAQLSKRPEAVFSSLWGGHFVTFAKQAKPLRYFEQLSFNFVGAGEPGSIESAKSMGDDYPYGIWGNSYDVPAWAERSCRAQGVYRARQEVHEPGLAVLVADHRLRRDAVPGRRHQEGEQHQLGQGRGGAEGHHRRHADRQADAAHQGPAGQSRPVLGQDGEGRQAAVRRHAERHVHRSDAVHGLKREREPVRGPRHNAVPRMKGAAVR